MVKYTVNATQQHHPIFAEASLRGSELAVAPIEQSEGFTALHVLISDQTFQTNIFKCKVALKVVNTQC